MNITTNKKDLEFKCKDVYFTEGLKIAKQLKQVVLFGKNKNCVGLAHNQIKGNKNVFIAKINNKWRTFINPFIVGCIDGNYSIEDNKYTHTESCMSFPNKSNQVTRYKKIELKYQIKARNDVEGGMWKTEIFYGFDACIIQHEVDHLNGIHIFNKNKEEKCLEKTKL
jgi:peptide deformylase